MDIRYLSYLSFCHAIPKLRSYCDQKLKLSLKFSYKYWTHCKTLSKTIQSLYFSLIFIFQSLKLEFERLSIFQKFSESFTKYLIRTFIHFNWPVVAGVALAAPFIWDFFYIPSVQMSQKCSDWDIFGLPCRLHQSQIPNVLPV